MLIARVTDDDGGGAGGSSVLTSAAASDSFMRLDVALVWELSVWFLATLCTAPSSELFMARSSENVVTLVHASCT